MKKSSEETRIIEKINQRKTFQSETWEHIDFILKLLLDAGFNRKWQTHVTHHKATGGQYFLMNADDERVTVLACEFLGKFIQVEFHRHVYQNIGMLE